jgi:photosystem II stability/assembly factor-like uncharacterized protein
MQDNYDWCGPSQVRGVAGIGNHQWTTIQGGDGFVALQDPVDPRVLYSESQDGNMVRVDRVTGESISVRPQAAPGEPALRWQWDTPLSMSPHDPKVMYAPANKVFRSPDRGLSWVAISGDLTGGANRDDIETMGLKGRDIAISRNDGIAAWPAITTFAESPKRAGVLYAGTDDGHLAVTRDAGKTWAQVIDKVPGLPKDIYVSRVAPSRFDEATLYVTFDGHRQNDFAPYIYASKDYGQTWQSIVGNLTGEVARTITEDLKNPDVLYLGTETGLFVTLDRGRGWTRIKGNLPTVRIDEITLHTRDNAMLLATHGRSIWLLDHIEPIQEYAAAQAAAQAKLFTPPASAMYRRPASDRNYEFWGDQTFFGENPPQAALLSWYLKQQVGEVRIKITDATGAAVREIFGQPLANSNKPGYQAACWDLRVQPVPTPPNPALADAAATLAARGGGGGGRAGGGAGAVSPWGAGCGGGGGRGGGGFGGGGGNVGPYVLPGTYNVSLIIDGKNVDTKPLKVMADPEVGLTALQRKNLYDMAMEMHDLQRAGGEVTAAIGPFNTRMTELAKEIASRNDIPADVKASVEAINKELAALMPKFAAGGGGGRGGGGGGAAGGAGGGAGAAAAAPGGAAGAPGAAAQAGGGGGRGGGAATGLARVSQAKNGLMGGMWPTESIMKAYSESKTEMPKAIGDVNALFGKATTLATTLAKYKLTLTVPAPIKAPVLKPAAAKKTTP